MDENRPLDAVKQEFQFDMTVVCANEVFECRVFSAMLADGTRFIRVLYGSDEDERTIDLEYWEEEGWIDLWYGEPSPWSAMVGPALDYHFALRKNA